MQFETKDLFKAVFVFPFWLWSVALAIRIFQLFFWTPLLFREERIVAMIPHVSIHRYFGRMRFLIVFFSGFMVYVLVVKNAEILRHQYRPVVPNFLDHLDLLQSICPHVPSKRSFRFITTNCHNQNNRCAVGKFVSAE